MSLRSGWFRCWIVTGACFLLAPAGIAQTQLLDAFLGDLPTEPRELADAILDDVEAIRGLGFQRDIAVSNQSREGFEAYLAGEIERSLPPAREAVYGQVVRKLGLYRGPLIEDAAAMMIMLATSQAAAYYDPEDSAFFVLVGDAPISMLAPIYAHELYHGLQDQYWDLDAYVLDAQSDGLNDDEVLARQAVVEGEATYVMTLWLLREMTGQVPTGFALDMAVQMQSEVNSSSLRQLAASSIVPGSLGSDLEASLVAMDNIPAFMMETLLGVYLKGMGFVHQVVRNGWDGADRLYTDPPRSTEQILHPEKWLERDDPVRITPTDIEVSPLLEGWTRIESNVIGEFQFRIIFNEFGMSDRSTSIAAGWDGDRFAIYQNASDLLLLMFTTWDSPAEADEFADAYRELLDIKYADTPQATTVQVDGSDVLIVEGGRLDEAAGYIELLASWEKGD